MALKKLTFLIHGFCYSEMSRGERNNEEHMPFLLREQRCARQWRSRVANFAEDHGLCILTWPHDGDGPAAEFERFAVEVLGNRCFILDAPQAYSDLYWKDVSAIQEDILHEVRSAFTGQGENWNKEELDTSLQTLACCTQLSEQCHARGIVIETDCLESEAWGASFEGCVLKFSLNLKRLLRLPCPIEIAYELTVPDYAKLVEAELVEQWISDDQLRCFLLKTTESYIGFFTLTTSSPETRPIQVALTEQSFPIQIFSKQGIRLWPNPEQYVHERASIGCREPSQQVVSVQGNILYVPASEGYVWRLSKAPAYIHTPLDTGIDEFRSFLKQTRL